ncbi:lysophospholipase [Frateuria sp. Soil773]|uniref:SGNH/GDSL hydrolase family protein n=1 Tax=Frateuria sp. Soil773 TaxID=1736407 RepID=UPI0006F5FB7B|nr:SGNH/GDSL hydrolase family protein [Frateuria sp. Soil773]KRF01938.1 lysophospholipase [Frateuria sp. Soil773]
MPAPLSYLALGDSYTIGEAVPAEARWPAVLARRLREGGVALGDPRIVAVTGWSTEELAAGMDAAGLAPPYDLVSLLIGVNDQYRQRPAEGYREPFRQLLQRAVALAGGRPARVVAVSIPDWGATRFGLGDARGAARIARELDEYNAIARDETRQAGAHWVDITPLSRRHPDLVADDGLHPSAQQYELWTGLILPAARDALG